MASAEQVPGWLVEREKEVLTPGVYDLVTSTPETSEELAQDILEAGYDMLKANDHLPRRIVRSETVGMRDTTTSGEVGIMRPASFDIAGVTIPEGVMAYDLSVTGTRRSTEVTFSLMHGDNEHEVPAADLTNPQELARIIGHCAGKGIEVDEVYVNQDADPRMVAKVTGSMFAWNVAGTGLLDLADAEEREKRVQQGWTELHDAWRDPQGRVVIDDGLVD